MNKLLIILAILGCSLTGSTLKALENPEFSENSEYSENPEPTVLSTVYYLEGGGERAFNTYLSPLQQTGSTWGLGGQWSRPMGHSRTWSMIAAAGARVGFLENPARNASMNDMQLDLSWHAMRSFTPLPGLTLGAGVGAELTGGLLYLPRNSNNPVAARAYFGAVLHGAASYRLRLWGTTFRLSDKVALPTLGVFFSPHYGQSYYEIYLGNRSGLARCGWWGNRFAIENLLAVDIPVSSVWLRVGYRLNVENSIASSINSRITTHSLVLGVCTDWVNVTRRHE